MGWAPLAADATLDNSAAPVAPPSAPTAPPAASAPPDSQTPPQSAPAAPTGTFAPLPANAQLDGEQPTESTAPLPGFTDDQKAQIEAYIPKAKDAADLEQYSREISGGQSHIGNAQAVMDAYAKGHRQFSWEAPTADTTKAASPSTGDQVKSAVGDGILNALDEAFPGLGSFLRDHQSAGRAFTAHVANAVAGDYGPEVAGALDTLTGGDLNQNIAHERAILEGESQGQGVASTAGELTGAGLVAPIGGEAVDAAKFGDIPSAIKAATGGAIYGSGAAGPGNRATGAVEGAALGAATDVAAPFVIKALTPKAAPAIDDAATKASQAAQDLGITLPKFALSDSDRATAGALEQTPFGRGPIVAARNALIDTSQAAKSGIANDLGTAPETAAQLGDQTLDAAVKSNKARRDNIGTLYDYANSMASGTQVQPTATLDTLNSLLSDESQKIGGSKIAPVLQSFRDDIAQRGTITVDQARSLRTDLRDMLTNDAGSTPSNADRITNQVMASVNADMKSSLPADAFDTYKQADTAWAQQRSLEDDVLKPFLGRDFDNWGDQVAQKINSDAKGNGVRLARFLSSLPDQDANNVRASIIQGLGKSRDGSQNAEGDAFSLGTFLTNWNQLSGSRKLIFPPDTVQALDKLAQVADVAKRAENMRNNSKTGGVISRLLMTGETSGSMVGFMTGHPHEAAVGLLLAGLTGARQYGAAKLLANPAFAKKLAATPLNPKAVQAFWSRPWVQALGAKNPAIAGEIQAFQSAVNDNLGAIPSAASNNAGQNQSNQNANSAQP